VKLPCEPPTRITEAEPTLIYRKLSTLIYLKLFELPVQLLRCGMRGSGAIDLHQRLVGPIAG
jgi:hypothetical protein